MISQFKTRINKQNSASIQTVKMEICKTNKKQQGKRRSILDTAPSRSSQIQNINSNEQVKLKTEKLESEINQLEQEFEKYDDVLEESEVGMDVFEYINEIERKRKETVYEKAMRCLSELYHPKVVSCRDSEKKDIQKFIHQGIATNGARQTLYISGVPGIGKTLCVNEVVKKVREEHKEDKNVDLQVIFVNAMNLKKAKDIFKVIWEKLSGTSKGSLNALYYLNDLFYKGIVECQNKISISSTKIIIIDEIDYLRTRDEEVIYTILEWIQQHNSKIILITISNTIDFPETMPPKIASRMGKSNRIIFKPYSSSQIETILKERLEGITVFEDQAVQYTCKRLAKCSSDIRKCLTILRESISTYLLECRRAREQANRVPLSILTRIHEESFADTIIRSYPELPYMHKVILVVLAKYFRYESVTCAYSELHVRCKPYMKGKDFNLTTALWELRDNGLLKTENTWIRSDKRINKGVRLHKFHFQQHVTLVPTVDTILYAANQDDKDLISIDD